MSNQALSTILSTVGWDTQSADKVEITGGADPVLPTPFRIGETAAASLAAVGLAVSDLWKLRTGRVQDVAIDVHQATASLRSGHYLKMDGNPVGRRANSRDGSVSGEERALELPALQLPQPPGCRAGGAGRSGGQGGGTPGRGAVGRAGTRGGHHRCQGRRRDGPFHGRVGAASSVCGGGVSAPAGNREDWGRPSSTLPGRRPAPLGDQGTGPDQGARGADVRPDSG